LKKLARLKLNGPGRADLKLNGPGRADLKLNGPGRAGPIQEFHVGRAGPGRFKIEWAGPGWADCFGRRPAGPIGGPFGRPWFYRIA